MIRFAPWRGSVALTFALCLFLVHSTVLPSIASAQSAAPSQAPRERSGAVSPLIERYMLDELKALRAEINKARVDMLREITDRELAVATTVSNVSNNTVTFFFYAFAALGAVFTLWGWRSIRDLKKSVQLAAETEITRLSGEYERRLTRLEEDLQSKGAIILENQREIERTQTVHALWLQANQAPNPRTKIEIYDRILELVPDDPETMAYKADAALQLGERDWALSLCNRILEDNPDSSLALYQRACAYAGLGEQESAVADLAAALDLTPALLEQARLEEEFAPLAGYAGFEALLGRGVEDGPAVVARVGAA